MRLSAAGQLLAGLLAAACAPEAPAPDAPGAGAAHPAGGRIVRIFWENQSWEVGGGWERLTLWADGRSSILVVPSEYSRNLEPLPGWAATQSGSRSAFAKEPACTAAEARELFERALEAGIAELESFQPDYVDGQGTLVGVKRADGSSEEKVIPMFTDERVDSANGRRFRAVAGVLGGFDVHAWRADG